jgi:oligopeptide/dipeptide ABC transporter ATP-binding protein
MQDQVFKYLDEVKEEMKTSMLMITHDISLVLESCERMAIMHGGQVAEYGSVSNLYDDPRHPYGILLQRAFPDIRYPGRELEIIEGIPPQNLGEVDYCTFADRCPWAIEECREGEPPLERIKGGNSNHLASCFRKEEMDDLRGEDGRKLQPGER